jgi:hypothetical protein
VVVVVVEYGWSVALTGVNVVVKLRRSNRIRK